MYFIWQGISAPLKSDQLNINQITSERVNN